MLPYADFNHLVIDFEVSVAVASTVMFLLLLPIMSRFFIAVVVVKNFVDVLIN